MELFDEAEVALCDALGRDDECRRLQLSAQLGFFIGAIILHGDRTVGAWFSIGARLKFRSWQSGLVVLDALDVDEAMAATKRMAGGDLAFFDSARCLDVPDASKVFAAAVDRQRSGDCLASILRAVT